MEIDLLEGCNVYYGSYIDNYNNGYLSRYYINEGKLVLSSVDTYAPTEQPQASLCATNLTYGSLHTPYYEFISLITVGFCLLLIYHVIIKRLLP